MNKTNNCLRDKILNILPQGYKKYRKNYYFLVEHSDLHIMIESRPFSDKITCVIYLYNGDGKTFAAAPIIFRGYEDYILEMIKKLNNVLRVNNIESFHKEMDIIPESLKKEITYINL